MVDEERVARLLGRVRDDTAALRGAAAQGAEKVAGDAVVLDAVKYRFVTVTEGCVRIAHHLLASEGWGVPETNAGTLRELGERGVLETSVAEAMARAVGFRNVLVHEYADVDDSRVVAQLDRLDDLDSFVRQVSTWVRAQRR